MATETEILEDVLRIIVDDHRAEWEASAKENPVFTEWRKRRMIHGFEYERDWKQKVERALHDQLLR